MKYFIIGFMGSGKSFFGRALAEEMGYSFLDLDMMMIEKEGKSIIEIFEDDGEDSFRKLEALVLRNTAKVEHTIVSTGGGAACFHKNLDWMKENGKVIYLKLFESELLTRLAPEKDDRPLLKDVSDEELPDFIYQLLRKRAYYYHQADIVIDPLSFEPKELAEMIRAEEATSTSAEKVS